MMNTLLSQTMDVEQKKKILEEKFHISMKSKLGERVNLMCNLSDLVEERGEVKGMLTVLHDMGYTMEAAIDTVVKTLKIESEKVYEIAKEFWRISS